MPNWRLRTEIRRTRANLTKSSNGTSGRAWRLVACVSSIAGALLLLCLLIQIKFRGTTVSADQSSPVDSGYVGSLVCAKCHSGIYESFSQTDMGRSMSEVTPAIIGNLPTSAEIYDSKINRHFEIHAQDDKLYQSEYETGLGGKDVFRNTQKIEWIIGSGANGRGAIIGHDDFLFEAPLSFYSKTHGWALSPGYEFGDYGFDRPILPACITCHSGQPRPVLNGNGRFQEPPFAELAIGCENCHGPGEGHVASEQVGSGPGSITNPGKLSSWLADNI